MSAYGSEALGGQCLPVLEALKAVVGEANDPQIKMRPIGFSQSMESDLNFKSAILQEDIVPGNVGIIRPYVNIRQVKRGTEGMTSTVQSCSPTAAGDDVYAFPFTIGQYLEMTLSFSEETMRRLCGYGEKLMGADFNLSAIEPDLLLMTQLVKEAGIAKLNGFWQDFNLINLNIAKAKAGAIRRDSNLLFGPQPITIRQDSIAGDAGKPVYAGLEQLLYDYEDNEQVGMPIVVANQNILKFFNSQKFFTINTFLGIDFTDIANSADIVAFKDKQVQRVMGDNGFLLYSPGSAQIIQWQRNRGAYYGDGGNMFRAQFTDPRMPNLPLDVDAWFQNCGNGYSTSSFMLKFSMFWDVFNPPIDMYYPTDPLYGTNGLFQYIAESA